MGELFKRNWRKVAGTRVVEPYLSLCELARLKDIAASGVGAVSGVVALSGDLSGNSDSAVVTGLQGQPISSGVPASGDALVWDGSQWAPAVTAGAQVATEFRIDIPAGGSLAAKIASAVLPAGWSIVLANDGSVDAEIVATANDIVLIHTEGAFAASIDILELDTNAAPLGGYYLLDTSGASLSKSNQTGTQFSVLGFNGLITASRSQRIIVRLVSTP